MNNPHPANHIQWWVVDSSNIEAVGYDSERGMYVRYKGGRIYLYHDVSRQQAVAAARARSVGTYIHEKVKPYFTCTRIT